MKKVLFVVLLFLVWITILAPLALILFLFATVFGWLIYAVAKIIDSIQSRPIGERTSEVVEDSIFLAYALVCALMIIPFETSLGTDLCINHKHTNTCRRK